MTRTTLFVTLLLATLATIALKAHAQTSDDLKNDEKTPDNVLVYGMGYSGNRFSPLTQINKENISKLVPAWSYSLTDLQAGESFPIVNDGVIYVTTHNSTVAVDATVGKQIWRVTHDYPPETLRVVCCGIVNRGSAIYDGMIIRTLMDDRLIALDAKTGKEIWQVASPEPAKHANGYSMTGAPLIVNGIVIVGVAGAEFSNRGFIEAYDAKTGKHLWRTYTIPAKGEPGSETWEGDSELTGGGSSWVTGTYDPELDLVYWGIGNPAPWNPRARKGDNLFTNSVWALRPQNGERVWYYQATPNDPFDYDAVETPINATIDVGGNPRKVVIQANRNGFLYVLDAKDGKLIAASAFGKLNWARGVDMETGRPIVTDVFKGALAGEKVTVWPSVNGVTNWQHLSFSPRTGLLYINTLHLGMTYEAPEPPKLTAGSPSGPPTVKRTVVVDDPNVRGYLKAVDPLTGKSKWEVAYRSPNYSSTMVTASNLLFTGVMTGEFQALDADTGKILWSFQNSIGHCRPAGDMGKKRQTVRCRSERPGRRLLAAWRRSQSPEPAYGRDAMDFRLIRQVTVLQQVAQHKRHQWWPRQRSDSSLVLSLKRIKWIRSGHAGAGAMTAFAAVFSFLPAALAQNDKSEQHEDKIAAGENIYNAQCSTCHGDQLVNTGQTFDLRRLTANDRARFNNSVRNGKNQMPPWKGVLSDEEIDQLWSYVRTNAYQK